MIMLNLIGLMMYTAMNMKLVLEIIKSTLEILPHAFGGCFGNHEKLSSTASSPYNRRRMGDEEAMLGDFSNNGNDFDDTIVKTRKSDERRGRS